MRFYRVLLHLYPKSFRVEYGDEMCAVHAERMRLATGPVHAAALWLEALRDVAVNAARVHADILRQDLHYTARALSRTPGFTATAIVVTALGIGANTAAFSITDRVFIRPLPFEDPDRLVNLWQRMPSYPRMELSPPNFRDWRAMSSSFSSMGAFTSLPMNLVGPGEAQRVDAAMVTSDLFPTLGVAPPLGRTFAPSDDADATAPTAILSYELWQTAFAGDASVIGRDIRLSGLDEKTHTIIGVMPRGFSFPDRETRIWVPFKMEGNTDRADNYLQVMARLKPGVSIDQARAEVTTVAAALEQAYPKENRRTGATITTLRGDMSGRARLLLVALFGASVCVLLIACTNLANLIMTRLLARRQEITIRAAMGAGRERLVRQLLTESLVLSLAGGVAGAALAIIGTPLLSSLAPLTVPIADPDAFDVRVLGFALAMTLVTGMTFGLVPAWRVCRGADIASLRERTGTGVSRRGERMRAALVLAEVTASIVLLVASGLLIRALWRVQAVDPGFQTDNVLTLRTAPPVSRYARTEMRGQFYDTLLSEVRALPGVSNAAYISFLPMVMRGGVWPVNVPGRPQVTARGDDSAFLRYVTSGFFATMGIPLLQGRDISASDGLQSPFVAVVSESFARKYWAGDNPIGRVFTFALAERTVVGVAGDVRVRGLERESEPQVYLSYKQVPDGLLFGFYPKDLAVKASGDPLTLMPAIRRIVKQADPGLPVSDVRMLEDIVLDDTAPRRTQVNVLTAFVVVSLVLAGVGIHGLLSFGVARRRSEIGLRVALGAQRGDVLRMILREGVVLACVGSAVGMVLAYVAGRAMQAVLAGVGPADTATFAAAIILAVLMTISGSVLPALRALRIDPATALRSE